MNLKLFAEFHFLRIELIKMLPEIPVTVSVFAAGAFPSPLPRLSNNIIFFLWLRLSIPELFSSPPASSAANPRAFYLKSANSLVFSSGRSSVINSPVSLLFLWAASSWGICNAAGQEPAQNSLLLKIGASPAAPSHYGTSQNESKISNAASSLTCSLSLVILQKTKIVCYKEDMTQGGCGQNTTIKY